MTAPAPTEPPPVLVTHYVTNVYDLTEPSLCQRAQGIERRTLTSNPLGHGHWLTAARHRVTCPACLEWLHA